MTYLPELRAPATFNGTKPGDCSVCRKIYDATCRGVGIPNKKTGCATATQAKVEYKLDHPILTEIITFIPAGSCGTIVTCPPGTSLKNRVTWNGEISNSVPAPVFFAWCEETGPKAGVWYSGVTLNIQFELLSMNCQPVI